MNGGKLRWGILGTAGIARKNWKAIRFSGNGAVVAVASRDLARARQFLAENQAVAPFDPAPRALGSYEELLAAEDVDAVYVPLPTGLRKEWLLRAAAAGKHIVCEKPCANGAADLREILDACRRHRVQFMDGVMFMHGARLARMRAALDDGTSVGELRRVTTAFSFLGGGNFCADNIRVHSGLEPFGCLGDLGWYCVRLSLWAAGWRLPREVTGRMLAQLGRPDSPARVPAEFSGELLFDGGLSASFHCSFLARMHQWAHFEGTRGGLRVDDFVNPRAGEELEFELNGARVAVAESGSPGPTAQETNLFRNFAAQVRSGALNETWPDIALKTQLVVDACLASARDGGRPVEPV
jgi:predicted dehydrogenase